MAFTFFFRDLQILELMLKYAVPDFTGRSSVKVWDAGCTMGQEPYTLAILFAEQMGRFAFRNVEIFATDIEESSNFGEIVRSGIYPGEELQRVPDELREKYFRPVNGSGSLQVIDSLRSKIRYARHDLLSLTPIGSQFSVVLCKNVLLHFNYEARIEVIKMFHRSLIPGGYFATEQTQKMPKEIEHLFEKVAAHEQIFRKVEVPC
ncbi:MAG: chemotaxis protein CheR [Chitinivibrionia bacterium]|nr:chemotaxis protein CheR [Chitinivibrionia bacterium]